MNELQNLDSFFDDIVANKKNNRINLSINSESINTIKLDTQEIQRAIPTMVHLKPKVREALMRLVSELQLKHQRRFTISQVGSSIIESALESMLIE